jgi:hypothetical protein
VITYWISETSLKWYRISYSLSKDHNQTIPVISWSRSTCPLCRTGRYKGNTIVHDFSMGEGDDVEVYSWAGIWPSKTTLKKAGSASTTATPTPGPRRKKGADGGSVQIKVETMQRDPYQDSDEDEDGPLPMTALGESGWATLGGEGFGGEKPVEESETGQD